jgi:hypothetical protein
MTAHKSIAVILLLALSACAEVRAGTLPRGDDGYVEVANPAATMSPGAPATIWVPRESLGSGVPRGSSLMEKSLDAVVNAIKREPQTVPQGGGAETPPAPYHHDSYR